MFKNTHLIQDKIKRIYDKRTKETDFQIGDFVLKWDARNEDKGKHGKFENLWKGPFKILAFKGKNAYLLEDLSDQPVGAGPVNGRLLKHFLT